MRKKILGTRSSWATLLLLCAGSLVLADESVQAGAEIRIMSWNIADGAFVTHPAEFRSLLLYSGANVLLLDEVAPSAGPEQLRRVLVEPESWQLDFGTSGGRQRGVIASRMPLEALPEFASILPYPEADQREIRERMPPAARNYRAWSMDGGIPVHGALVHTAGRRLLVVVADLQCCGNEPGSWQEFKRQIETAEIQKRVRQVLDRIQVDGMVLAGDFNLVNTPIPLTILAGPYQAPHLLLTPAEPYHLDGTTNWTWDGRGTPFPSGALDYQLYSSHSLGIAASLVLDTEDLSDEELELSGLKSNTSRQLSDHRPLIVEYSWH